VSFIVDTTWCIVASYCPTITDTPVMRELHVYVMDFDKIGSNDCIGIINFSLKDQGTAGNHWRQVLSNPKKSIALWHSLQPVEDDK